MILWCKVHWGFNEWQEDPVSQGVRNLSLGRKDAGRSTCESVTLRTVFDLGLDDMWWENSRIVSALIPEVSALEWAMLARHLLFFPQRTQTQVKELWPLHQGCQEGDQLVQSKYFSGRKMDGGHQSPPRKAEGTRSHTPWASRNQRWKRQESVPQPSGPAPTAQLDLNIYLWS